MHSKSVERLSMEVVGGRATRSYSSLRIHAIRVLPLVVVTLCLQAPAEQKPDFTGAWKLRTERPGYSEVWTVKQTESEIRLSMNIVDDQLGDRVLTFTATLDGKEHRQTVIGTQASVIAGWEDSGLRLVIKRQARPDLLLHNRRLLRLSSDKKRIDSRLTQESPPPRVERDEIFERLTK
jgi:hypothetical protein